MALNKNTFCHGIEPYNFRDTGETVATITANVGQSTAIGPKVAIRRNRPFDNTVVAIDMGGWKKYSQFAINISPTVACTHGGEPVIGTIDASIYRKNSNQDNSKYVIINHQRKTEMGKQSPIDIIEKAIGNGKDVVGVINLSESLLKIVASGTLTIEETMDSLCALRKSLCDKDVEKYSSMAEAIKDINADAPHQQDQLNCQDDAARTLAASTHGAASHLTKTVVEEEDDQGKEMCVVRRLTPTETSRLQGFPDDYTKIDGIETADAPQFKAHGNSWATPCANFVSTRMEMELRRLGHEGTIRYATCCSGIEAHSVAVRNLDWRAMFFSEIEPFPCRVLEKHYPNVPNLGDMTQIHFDDAIGAISNAHKEGDEYSLPSCFKEAQIQALPFKKGDLEVFSGGTPCQSISIAGKREGMAEGSGTRSSLAWHYQRIIDESRPMFTLWENVCFGADTLVTTNNGHKKICDIKVGDNVRSFDGKYHRVEKVMETKDKETILLTAMGSEKMVVTPNHPFYARIDLHNKSNPFKREFTKPEWVAAGELTKDHYIGYKLDEIGTKSIGMAKAYAVGRWLADGSVALRSSKTHTGSRGGQRARIFISTGWKKHDSLAAELSRLPYKINESKVKDYAINFTFTSDDFYMLIADCGKGARTKKVPEYAYSLKPEEQGELLRGYFDGDGHKHGAREMTYSSSSRELAMGIARLVRDVYHRGVSLQHIKGKGTIDIDGRVVKAHDSWAGSFSNEIISSDGKTHLISFVENGYVWCPVKKIESSNRRTVYNLTVADTHTYEANDIVVHNCGAFSSNGGADFILFVNRCAESGYAMAWRVLDAQYTMTEEFPRAVPQRRRRIWLVGYRENDWHIPARIVFELEKELTDNPPERIPGIGFKALNPDADVESLRNANKKKDDNKKDDSFLDLFAVSEDYSVRAEKVSQMIPLDKMPEESDFSKLPMVTIYEFAKSVGEPGYLGPVFRTDKKTAMGMLTEDEKKKLSSGDEEIVDKYNSLKEKEDAGELKWEGAEKISPQILENIGNAGILSNGRILTMTCHEWTSGIQLSPKTFNEWDESMKHNNFIRANELLPESYDETVCGLSDVLEENPDEKYNLSWRACFGILRRAETRGKELPSALHIALISTIRENAGIVKWVALNGKDTKKKETDLSEKESARACFERYISQVADFDDIIPVQPKRKTNESEEDEEVEEEDCDIQLDDEGNHIEDEGFGDMKEEVNSVDKDKVPDMPNGCINESGGETAPTIVASQYKGPGNTQDATIVGIKKIINVVD
ncbi:MAG: DNA cytosine methyltransferase [Prevotella sp.]|nr:DNA cytosine methyltransferase [Prevotella sp.]